MITSELINEIATAGAKAQTELKPAVKDSTNPAFRSKYADMASVVEASRVYARHGIAVWQDVQLNELGVSVITRLTHTSGQWMEFGPITVPLHKHDAHGVGSASTYAKRYGLSAALSISSDEDDDGNAAAAGMGHTQTRAAYVNTSTGEIAEPKANGHAPLTVERVDTAPTRKPGMTRYTVFFSNGTSASTIKDRLGALANELAASGETILPPIAKVTQYGTDLIEIHRKTEATVTNGDVPEITDADIPF